MIFAIQTSGMWRLLPTDAGRAELVTRTLQAAQRAITLAANQDELIEFARQSAERLLKEYLDQALSWELSIRWMDQTVVGAEP